MLWVENLWKLSDKSCFSKTGLRCGKDQDLMQPHGTVPRSTAGSQEKGTKTTTFLQCPPQAGHPTEMVCVRVSLCFYTLSSLQEETTALFMLISSHRYRICHFVANQKRFPNWTTLIPPPPRLRKKISILKIKNKKTKDKPLSIRKN